MIHKIAQVKSSNGSKEYFLYFDDAKEFEPFHIIQRTDNGGILCRRYCDLIFAVKVLQEKALTY